MNTFEICQVYNIISYKQLREKGSENVSANFVPRLVYLKSGNVYYRKYFQFESQVAYQIRWAFWLGATNNLIWCNLDVLPGVELKHCNIYHCRNKLTVVTRIHKFTETFAESTIESTIKSLIESVFDREFESEWDSDLRSYIWFRRAIFRVLGCSFAFLCQLSLILMTIWHAS